MTGPEIRRRRLELGMTQIRLARLASVDNGDLCRTEYDQPRGLSDRALARVVAVIEELEASAEAQRAARRRLAALVEGLSLHIGGAHVS